MERNPHSLMPQKTNPVFVEALTVIIHESETLNDRHR